VARDRPPSIYPSRPAEGVGAGTPTTYRSVPAGRCQAPRAERRTGPASTRGGRPLLAQCCRKALARRQSGEALRRPLSSPPWLPACTDRQAQLMCHAASRSCQRLGVFPGCDWVFWGVAVVPSTITVIDYLWR
jgi:hypothetical protein